MAADRTSERKLDHVRICLNRDVQARQVSAGFGDVALVHRALSDIDLGRIDISCKLLGREASSPLVISSMTGGTEKAETINRTLAEVAEEMAVPISVGSMRAAIEESGLERTFKVVRECCSKAMVIANIGAVQLVSHGPSYGARAVEMIEADALAVHLNKLQEGVMVGGDTAFNGVSKAIAKLVEALDVPVIAKETGAGVSSEDARLLKSLGVKCIDVAGAGGTSFAGVEYFRAAERGSSMGQKISLDFWDWGIPTVASLAEVRSSVDLEVICSGGVRGGVDAAKALALGATCVGVALPLLRKAQAGPEAVRDWIRLFNEELKLSMFLSGASNLEEMRRCPVVVTGAVRDWLLSRGFDVDSYSRRKGA
ncbi:MAG: type 2 isopentenyl-diphosphate Delta-isomerase [Candidatus Brockarchaeota archaeon]|nr:type 2 isopentenyl-diphosphate Delta-isomerase [Candidatus Brockarchaeota archaeon]